MGVTLGDQGICANTEIIHVFLYVGLLCLFLGMESTVFSLSSSSLWPEKFDSC